MARIPRLVGSFEIGQMLGGIARQRVDQLAATRDFPLPVATLKQGRVWVADDIEKWATRRGRATTRLD